MGNNSIKKLLVDALEHTQDDWTTRATIASYLKAPSGGLNPGRKSALEQLVRDGKVEQRTQPDTGKQTLEFRLKKG